ncbi:MAG TPA: hypothetical protein VFI31_16915 [Pirellulales bacterium]|nr:hypothetical protein [Pirellulales bacterium]
MNCVLAAVTTACLGWAEPEAKAPPTSPWFGFYDRTAAEYEMFRDRDHNERLELQAKAVYKFNAVHVGDVSGAVYVWTRHGCAEAVGCFWKTPWGKAPTVCHELHSLSPVVLAPRRPGSNEWRPKGKLDRQLIDDAPAPAEKPSARGSQMRSLAREFTGYTVAEDGERRELRLLTAPLYRYQSNDADVLDGALFVYICTVGTDPEVFLVVESLRTPDGPRWHYALARFGNRGLFMKYRNREVWRSVRGGDDTIDHSADHTYWTFHEPVAEGGLAPNGKWDQRDCERRPTNRIPNDE